MDKKLQSYIRDILLLCLILYKAQGGLFPQGTIVTQLILLFILIVSAFYFVKTLMISNNKDSFYYLWTALLVLNIIGFVFDSQNTSPSHFGMFRGIMITMLTFYPFYYFAQRNLFKAKHLLRFFILMFPITISGYFFKMNQVFMEKGIDDGDIVNNVAYIFVWLTPYIFLFKKHKILSFVLSFVTMVFIIQGAKRGAIVVGGLGLLIFIYYQLRTLSRKNRVRGYLLSFTALIGMGYYAYNYYINNEFLIYRMELTSQGYSSGRDIIATRIFEGWLNSESYYHLLFGYGFAASRDFAGNFAHNDWLELLSNFGLLGVTLYLFLFRASYKNIRLKAWSIDKRLLMLTVVSMWFLITLFSMGYTSNNSFLMTLLLAYLIGNKNRELT